MNTFYIFKIRKLSLKTQLISHASKSSFSELSIMFPSRFINIYFSLCSLIFMGPSFLSVDSPVYKASYLPLHAQNESQRHEHSARARRDGLLRVCLCPAGSVLQPSETREVV